MTQLGGAPPFVSGVSIIRGEPTPVVDVGRLLGLSPSPNPTRWLTVQIGTRCVALALESVIGFKPLDDASFKGLPPLLAQLSTGVVSQIGSIDSELLLVLETARIVPDSLWHELDSGARG